MLKITSVELKGIGGIDNLNFTLEQSVNIICGPNGVGKSTITECIASMFSNAATPNIKRNASYEIGSVRINAISDSGQLSSEAAISNFEPSEFTILSGRTPMSYAKEILYFKPKRSIPYSAVTAVERDLDKNATQFGTEAINGISIRDLKNWLINRILWSKHDILEQSQIDNLNAALGVFSQVDNKIEFSRVKHDTYDIMVKNRINDTEIYFEYLSSGYKSIIYLALGIIKEIEIRYKEPHKAISEFDGVIIIDEVDLHLHPTWQIKVLDILRSLFPIAQIIATTHSPHILQSVEPQEILALNFNSEGEVVINQNIPQEYGLKGWSIEEILTDVMGLEQVFASDFSEIIQRFDFALDTEDVETATSAYSEIAKMLHPHNPLRKMYSMQLSGLTALSQQND